MNTLEERIEQEKLQIEENREKLAYAVTIDNQHAFDTCMRNIEEHERLLNWLEELRFLRKWKSDIVDTLASCECNNLEELKHKVQSDTLTAFSDSLIRNSQTMVVDGDVALIVTDKRLRLVEQLLRDSFTK